MKDKLIRKILPNLENVEKKEKKYLLGLSGGADSVSLLYVLKEMGYELVVVHVHHGVREESDEELEFCKRISEELGVEFVSKKLEFRNGESKNQEVYRNKRYDFFKQVYTREKVDGIFLGQHFDDQIENMVGSFFKRKSVSSLKAMEVDSNVMGMRILRPLLTVRKREVLDMIARHGIEFRTDKSNFEAVYERNKIRLELMPMAEKIFGKGIYKTLREMNISARETNEAHSFYSEKLKEKYFEENEIDLKCLKEHSIEILMNVVDEILKENDLNLDKAFLKNVKVMIENKNTGTVSKKGVEIIVTSGKIKVEMKK